MKYVERIAIDKSYVENLAFRINNDLMKRYGAGNEPSEVCSPSFKINPENISETLSNFVADLANAKGIEKNLVAKKYIAKINYAPDVIKISFLLKENSALALNDKNYAPELSIGKNAPVSKNENPPLVRETEVRSYFQSCPSWIKSELFSKKTLTPTFELPSRRSSSEGGLTPQRRLRIRGVQNHSHFPLHFFVFESFARAP